MAPQMPSTDAHVRVRLLNGGSMIASAHMLHVGEGPTPFHMYNWAFLVHHEATNQRLIWDLGMTSDKEAYATAVKDTLFDQVQITGPKTSLTDQLREYDGGNADTINAIIFSHAHWDHCRPFKTDFPNAKAYFGPCTYEYCAPGHLVDPTSLWDGRFFDPTNSTEPSEALSCPWIPFDPFERAMDYFGDQSFRVIQAPGHMPGNLCACARLESGDWVLLGSDCCHSRALLDGTKDFAYFPSPDGTMSCLHTDVTAARDTIARLKVMEEKLGVHIALAHDASWLVEGTDQVLLSLVEEKLREKLRRAVPLEEAV